MFFIAVMSSYHDYSGKARKYEANRVPVGVNHILGALHVRLGKPLEQVRILDAGCGTGNYAKELLEAGVGQIYLLDADDGMLGACKIKLKAYSDNGRVVFVKHKLPTLPYQDKYFDCILLMKVLHYIDEHNFDHLLNTEEEPSYPDLKLACQEGHRVLKPGGFAVISTILNDQINSIWWHKLTPIALRRMCIYVPEYHCFRAALKGAGFQNIETISFLDKHFMHEAIYFDPDGPLREEFRENWSCWSLATKHEIDDAIKRLMEAKGDETATELMLSLIEMLIDLGDFLLCLLRNRTI